MRDLSSAARKCFSLFEIFAIETIILAQILKTKTCRALISILVSVLLIGSTAPTRLWATSGNSAQSQTEMEQVKAAVAQIGTDPNVHVKVKLRDGKKVEGYISAINADSFSVTKERTAKTTTIGYADVVRIEKSKAKLPGRGSAFWRVLVGVGLVVILVVIYVKSDRPG